MNTKKIRIVIGGTWHDFEGFSKAIHELLTPNGFEIETTYDMDSLTTLTQDQIQLLISYTCLSNHREGYEDTAQEGLSDAQVDGLERWLRLGGGFLGVHSATVLGNPNPKYASLIGGKFIEHPPQFAFTVYPMIRSHPMTEGIEAFTIHDELYMQQVADDVQIHMITMDRGSAYPMVWTRREGKGKIAYIAPGHADNVWNHPAFQKMTRQGINWLLSQDE